MKYTFCFLFAAFLAFGQTPQPQPKQLTTQEAENAWRMVQNQPKGNNRAAGTVLQIPGAVLMTEKQINAHEEKIWFTFNYGGTYLFQGMSCTGNPVWIGETRWDFFSPEQTGIFPMLDIGKFQEAMPLHQPFCYVTVYRIENGRIEELRIDPGRRTKISQDVFGEYQRPSGEYVLYLRSGRTDINVSIGRYAVASRIERDMQGNVLAVFPPTAQIPETGVTTITICQDGVCETNLFERRLEIPPPVPTTGTGSSGKG